MNNTAKRRFLDICHFDSPGDLCLLFGLNIFIPQTLTEWVKQGAPDSFGTSPTYSYMFDDNPIQEYFKLEPLRSLYEIHSGIGYGAWVGTGLSTLGMPLYEPRVIDEDERTITMVNPSGQTIKMMKGDDLGYHMPMFIDWPVKDRPSWKEYKKRLDPTTPERYPPNWEAYVQETNDLTCPVSLEVGGFFGYLREWMGFERLLYMFYDDPGLIEDMMDTVLHLETEIFKRVSKDVKLDMVTYWEDMAYKAGPMISPEMFRKFLMPRYKKLNELIRSVGVDVVFVDSDGNLDLLIPLWLECGVNFVWPLEVAAGNDVVALRKKYGTDLIMGGGIDKLALIKGKEATKQEVMSKVPFLLDKGGYFPSLDHFVPPNVPFENFCYFVNLLREIAGLEKLPFE